MSELSLIKIFVQVVENNGFSKTAAKLNITTPAISKQIAKLEQKLNTQLFIRTTRNVTLTTIGKIYYEHCKQILEAINESKRAISHLHSEPIGKLRITSGRYFAKKYIIPHLLELSILYPKLIIDIEVAERTPDLAYENIDIIFGSDYIDTANLSKKLLTSSRYIICGSPAYLKKHGVPNTPADLNKHYYITHSMRNLNNILYFKNQQQICVEPKLYLNDAESMLYAAINSVGIVTLNEYIVADAIEQGLLVSLLQEYSPAERKIYIFYKKSLYLEPKIHHFIDFITNKFN